MKKKTKIIIATCAAFLMMSGAVLAKSPNVRIFINNIEFDSSAFKLNIDNGTSMVSLKSIVEQFNGKVTYKDRSIFVTTPESTNVAMQLNSLENALIATTPEEAVQTWIKGVQNRSGAMQYAVLSPELRQQTKQQFEENFWVTGGSSPHMGKVEKLQSREITANKFEISFEYPLVVMTETIDTGSATITVEKIKRESSDYWAISKIVLKDPEDTGTMIGVEVDGISYENKEHHFTLTIPKNWEGKYEVVANGNDAGQNVDFINKASTTGTLFTISVWSKQYWDANEKDITGIIPIVKLGEKAGVVYIFHTPTDVQYDSSDEIAKKDYDTMFKDVTSVKNSFKLAE